MASKIIIVFFSGLILSITFLAVSLPKVSAETGTITIGNRVITVNPFPLTDETTKIKLIKIPDLVPGGCYMVKDMREGDNGFDSEDNGKFVDQPEPNRCLNDSDTRYEGGEGDICNDNPHRRDADNQNETENCVEASEWGREHFLQADSTGTLTIRNICEGLDYKASSCGDPFDRGETYELGIFLVREPPIKKTEAARNDDDNGANICQANEGPTNAKIDTCDVTGALFVINFGEVVRCEDEDVVCESEADDLTQFEGTSIDTPFGQIRTDPEGLASDLITIAASIAGGVAFLLLIYGSFRFMFSAGNPEAVQQGREIITSAIVGLIVVIFSVFILRLIGISILGLPI